MHDSMERIAKQVEEIGKQVEYNGGSSMKDSLRRVEEQIQSVSVQLREVKGQVELNAQMNDFRDMISDKITFKVAPDGSCYRISEAFLRFFGWKDQDVLGYNFENIVHDDDVGEMRMKWQRAIDTQSQFQDEQRIRDVHGKYHRCIVKASPMSKAGVLVKFYGNIEIIKTENNG